jgi:hypothetical protein
MPRFQADALPRAHGELAQHLRRQVATSLAAMLGGAGLFVVVPDFGEERARKIVICLKHVLQV